MKKFQQFVLINLEWNRWNSLCITVGGIEYGDFERSLFSFWTNWKDHFVINVLFFEYNNRDK